MPATDCPTFPLAVLRRGLRSINSSNRERTFAVCSRRKSASLAAFRAKANVTQPFRQMNQTDAPKGGLNHEEASKSR